MSMGYSDIQPDLLAQDKDLSKFGKHHHINDGQPMVVNEFIQGENIRKEEQKLRDKPKKKLTVKG